jgi:hypothetical protein
VKTKMDAEMKTILSKLGHVFSLRRLMIALFITPLLSNAAEPPTRFESPLVRQVSRSEGKTEAYTFLIKDQNGQIQEKRATPADPLYQDFFSRLKSLELYDESIFRYLRSYDSLHIESELKQTLEKKLEEFLEIPVEKLRQTLGTRELNKLDWKTRGMEALKALIKSKNPHSKYFLRLAHFASEHGLMSATYQIDHFEEIDMFLDADPNLDRIVMSYLNPSEPASKDLVKNFPIEDLIRYFQTPSPIGSRDFSGMAAIHYLPLLKEEAAFTHFYKSFTTNFLDLNYTSTEIKEAIKLLKEALIAQVIDGREINFAQLFDDSLRLGSDFFADSIDLIPLVPQEVRPNLVLGLTRRLFETNLFTTTYTDNFPPLEKELESLSHLDSRAEHFLGITGSGLDKLEFATKYFPRLSDLASPKAAAPICQKALGAL